MDDSSPMVGKPHPAARGPQRRRCAIRCRWNCTSPRRRIARATCPASLLSPSNPATCRDPTRLAPYEELREHASGLIRVLDDDSTACGAWVPEISGQQLRHGLEMMLRARHLDARMIAMQRQGRLSFYVTSRGEEAVAVAGAMAYAHRDMLFPSYRQPGLLAGAWHAGLAMMCQASATGSTTPRAGRCRSITVGEPATSSRFRARSARSCRKRSARRWRLPIAASGTRSASGSATARPLKATSIMR